MKKFFLLLMLLVPLVGVTVGCGDTATEPTTDTSPAPTPETDPGQEAAAGSTSPE